MCICIRIGIDIGIGNDNRNGNGNDIGICIFHFIWNLCGTHSISCFPQIIVLNGFDAAYSVLLFHSACSFCECFLVVLVALCSIIGNFCFRHHQHQHTTANNVLNMYVVRFDGLSILHSFGANSFFPFFPFFFLFCIPNAFTVFAFKITHQMLMRVWSIFFLSLFFKWIAYLSTPQYNNQNIFRKGFFFFCAIDSF